MTITINLLANLVAQLFTEACRSGSAVAAAERASDLFGT